MDKCSFWIEWCAQKKVISRAIAFFVNNVGVDYISHGEVQSGRADNLHAWSINLADVLRREFNQCFASRVTGHAYKLALTYKDGVLIGLMFVEINKASSQKFAILQDMIIKKGCRGHNFGGKMLSWLERELKKVNVNWLFLESGAKNHRAHAFFNARGFKAISKVMAKELP